MTQHIVAFITAGSREEADKISKGLVEEKLAFCVNSVPGIKSTYFWEGKLCVDDEFLLIAIHRGSEAKAVQRPAHRERR